MVKHGGHRGISFLFIQPVTLSWQAHCGLGPNIHLQSGAKLKFTKLISMPKIMLIFNTYNTLNLK